MKLGYALHAELMGIEDDASDPDEKPTPIYRVSAWQWGAFLYVVGNLLQFFSFAFAAQTLLLAMASVQFALHLASAWLLEGVAVPRRSIGAAVVVIAANVLLVAFSSKASDLLDSDELVALHRYLPSTGWLLPCLRVCSASQELLGLIGAVVTTPVDLVHAPDGSLAQPHAQNRFCRELPYLGYLMVAGTVSFTCSALYLILRCSPADPATIAAAPLQPVLLALGASVPATQMLIMAKSFSMMVVKTVGGENQIGTWFFWAAPGTAVAAMALWAATTAHGIARFPTIVIVPVLQVCSALPLAACMLVTSSMRFSHLPVRVQAVSPRARRLSSVSLSALCDSRAC